MVGALVVKLLAPDPLCAPPEATVNWLIVGLKPPEVTLCSLVLCPSAVLPDTVVESSLALVLVSFIVAEVDRSLDEVSRLLFAPCTAEKSVEEALVLEGSTPVDVATSEAMLVATSETPVADVTSDALREEVEFGDVVELDEEEKREESDLPDSER